MLNAKQYATKTKDTTAKMKRQICYLFSCVAIHAVYIG